MGTLCGAKGVTLSGTFLSVYITGEWVRMELREKKMA